MERPAKGARQQNLPPDESTIMSKSHSRRRRPVPAPRALPAVRRPWVERLEDRTLLSGNPIVAENQLPGTPESVWGVGAGNTTLQGFATDMSVNRGQTISFKVNDSA